MTRRLFPCLIFLSFSSLLTGGPGATAAEGDTAEARLTIDRIFASGEFRSEGFSGRWIDGETYVTLEPSTGPNGGRDLVRHDARSGARQILVPASDLVPPGRTHPLDVSGWSLSKDRSLLLVFTNTRRVWRYHTRGDYWLLDRSSRALRRLGGDAPEASLMFAKISPSSRQVAYVRDRDIWVEDVRTGSVRRLTTAPSDRVIHGTFDWVYEEELGLRDGFRWSPDSTRIAYWQIDTSGVRDFPLVNNTASFYPEVLEFAYPKTGERNSACRVGVVPVSGGATRWIDLPGDSREHYVARMEWVDRGELTIQQLNRLQNTNRVFLADPSTGSARCAFVDRDDAWLRAVDEVHWIGHGAEFTWISERDGWRHVWAVARESGEARCVTTGAHDAARLLAVDEASDRVWYIASPDDPTRRYLWTCPLSGGPPERVTPADQVGWHAYDIAPGGSLAVHTFSTLDTPPVVELVSLPGHERVRVLVDNARVRERVEGLARARAEFFRVEIEDGVEVDAWCIAPPEREPGKRYPVLVYVYGEPAGQTTVDRWGGSGYLWHLMLAQRGYAVLNFDNRGTPAPRGRAWRKHVYRKVGIVAPVDQASALRRTLEDRPWLDPERVAIWGWSGGGSMSLNAIFRYPDLYDVAMSIAPVPNQRYYDTIYQERYMGLPSDNPEGYIEGSPITHAHRLQGDLLLVHGTGDDNCHYQGMEALIDELIRHRKRFTMMAYPNRSHSIREGVNTTLHLRDLLTRYLESHVDPGPR